MSWNHTLNAHKDLSLKFCSQGVSSRTISWERVLFGRWVGPTGKHTVGREDREWDKWRRPYFCSSSCFRRKFLSQPRNRLNTWRSSKERIHLTHSLIKTSLNTCHLVKDTGNRFLMMRIDTISNLLQLQVETSKIQNQTFHLSVSPSEVNQTSRSLIWTSGELNNLLELTNLAWD